MLEIVKITIEEFKESIYDKHIVLFLQTNKEIGLKQLIHIIKGYRNSIKS